MRINHLLFNIILLVQACLVSVSVLAAPADHFVTTWKTDNPGTLDPASITVPMVGGPYDVDWNNDGLFEETVDSGSITHNFNIVGTYTIRIQGAYDSIQFADGGDKEKILSLDQWGTNSWTSMNQAFSGATNLTIPATDNPDFSTVADMAMMFLYAISANPDTSGWNTSAVTTMRYMFAYTTANPDTRGWDTSNVTNMYVERSRYAAG